MADDSAPSTTPAPVERMLRTRVDELEAEAQELRVAADQSRRLVSECGAEVLALRTEIEDLRARVRELSSPRGALTALRQATRRRVVGR